MNAMSIPPKNLLILAALGIGAYWFVTRQARAASGARGAASGFMLSPARASSAPGAQPNLGAGLFAALGTFLGGKPSGGSGTIEVTNTASPGQIGWGWSYYSDGTAISPDGTYYKDGRQIWSPASADSVAGNPANAYSNESWATDASGRGIY